MQIKELPFVIKRRTDSIRAVHDSIYRDMAYLSRAIMKKDKGEIKRLFDQIENHADTVASVSHDIDSMIELFTKDNV